jgi:L-threonylcarbamoyladenylate synthase
VKTEVWHLGTKKDASYIKEAADRIRSGQLVIFPTETVYGVGALPEDKSLQERIYQLKGRPSSKPFSWHLSSVSHLGDLPVKIKPCPLFSELAIKFMPGPMTAILMSELNETIGVRVPDYPFTNGLIEALGGFLLATSANDSGHPSPRSAEDVLSVWDGKVDLVLDGGKTPYQGDSTVVDFTSEPFKILRPGVYSALKQELI